MPIEIEAPDIAERTSATAVAGRVLSHALHAAPDHVSKSAVRERTGWIRQLHDCMPDAVLLLSDSHRVSACNKTAIGLFGYEEDELIGCTVDFLWSATPDIRLKGRWSDHGAVRAGEITPKSGDRFPATLTVIRQRRGRQVFTAAVFEDLRAERETLQQVQTLQNELARIARVNALGEMASTLAHELSQPLSSIAAYSQGCSKLVTADHGPESETVRDVLTEITEHALRGGNIIQHMLEFSRSNTGGRAPATLHDLIRQAAGFAFAGARTRGIQPDLHLQAGQDIALVDRVQVMQVLTNLIRNALDATDRTEQPDIAIRTRTEDGRRIVVEVSDNGCGIPADIEETLFRPFITSKPHGLGLGLALSRRIVEAHGGRMSARRRPEGGAIFSFSLPLMETVSHGE
ncbi:PAS domain-containing sensor histidine kinase [Rhizobium sp. Root708]|uniref:sensor histidine kinase n=1 Tax=Rhizobium sp. Root708 TaxID=1736592 RepID=UPI000700817C|nr:ATP-binding protein [Rhizobium sp. Root708]KRB50017.1 PAS domain-containing sensor histidine kinase [Rhizobium sp. Root708]